VTVKPLSEEDVSFGTVDKVILISRLKELFAEYLRYLKDSAQSDCIYLDAKLKAEELFGPLVRK
jgi:hypothetical protein